MQMVVFIDWHLAWKGRVMELLPDRNCSALPMNDPGAF